MRGSRMHGYGNTQKHRGAGSRGGHGMAGSKKQKWHYVSKYLPGYFGEKGFKRHHGHLPAEVTINVGQLSANIEKFVADGAATGSKGTYTIDLTTVGYTKLLGTGKVENKLKITVATCSQSAKKKIEAAGGSVETTEKETESAEKSGD
jgi:large subunit ribosomal protein L15